MLIYAPKGASTFYGHAEIAIGDKIYSYGRYDPASVEGPGGIYGDGVLVVADKEKWLSAATKERDVYGYTLNLTKEEAEDLEKYYTDRIENEGVLWKEEKEKDKEYQMYKFESCSQYQKYEFVGGDNCATIIVESLESSVNDKITSFMKDSISPAMILRSLQAVYNIDKINPFYKNGFVTEQTVYPKVVKK